MIDITEFYDSMENFDDHDEAVEAHEPEKEFPTNAEAHDVQVMERRRVANHSRWFWHLHRTCAGQRTVWSR